MLAGRGHNRSHALRAAAGRATFVARWALLIITALQLAARRARYKVRALARLGRKTCRHRWTILVWAAVHVDHRAGLVQTAGDVAAWLVTTTLFATGCVHLVAIRADQVAVQTFADPREFPDGFTVDRGGLVQFSLQDHSTMVHAFAARTIVTLQRLVTAILLALWRRNCQRHSFSCTFHAIVKIPQILAH